MIEKSFPWREIVQVADIPDAGLHLDIEADAATRREIAAVAGLQDLQRLTASFELQHAAGERILLHGRVSAAAGQTCVVTLEPIESLVDETFDLVFAPKTQTAAGSDEIDEDNSAHDPPEPIINGQLDLGAVATEYLILGLDPYPRKPAAVFNPVVTPDDPADHPFAALAALKADGSAAKPKKAKDK